MQVILVFFGTERNHSPMPSQGRGDLNRIERRTGVDGGSRQPEKQQQS
jgi:hypothetical protein